MVLELQDIHKSFPSGFLMRRRPVLRGLSLRLEEGEAYALLGANGAGKSTTLRILLGLSRPDRGSGRLLGYALGDRRAHAQLGYLPENPSFHEQLTAAEFLRFCGRLLGLHGRALRTRIDTLLDRVGLQPARDRRLRKLSKGMLQRLGLAQALLGDPPLLVLDEPMSGLDPPGRKLVRDLIVEQRDAGKTVLFSTHILGDAEVVCNRAGMLRDGVLASEFDLDALPDGVETQFEVTLSGLDPEATATLATRATLGARGGGCTIFTLPGGEALHRFIVLAVEHGGQLVSVVPRRPSLEQLFLEATSGDAPRARASNAAPPRREPQLAARE